MLITQDAAEAEEAAQDAFVKAWRALGRFRRGRAAAAVAADDRRQRGAQPPPLGRPPRARWRCARRAATPRTARPRRRCSPARRARALLAALARLRDDDRLVLGCRYLLELSEAETAAALGVPAGHRQVAHVARARAPARGGDAMTDLETRAARARRRVAGDAGPRDRGAARGSPRAARRRGSRRRVALAARPGALARPGVAASPPRSSLLAGGTLAVSPEARSTVLRWLGLKSVEIKREPPRPADRREPRPRRRPLDAARAARACPEGARRRRTRSTTRRCPTARDARSLVYAGPPPVLVQTFRRARRRSSRRRRHGGRRRAPDRRRRARYWITGVARVRVRVRRAASRYEQQRLADRTLLVERDGLLLRVEGAISRERAVEIARSVQ